MAGYEQAEIVEAERLRVRFRKAGDQIAVTGDVDRADVEPVPQLIIAVGVGALGR
jgi:hypothetical protein